MTPRFPPVSPDEFRTLMSRFASGVTVLTATDADGKPHGMTVSAFASLSLEPPLVLACVSRVASMLGVLDQSPCFAISILSEGQAPISQRFAIEEMQLRFEGVPHRPGPGGAPLLDGALAGIECRRMARYDAGDHVIFIGEVTSGWTTPGARPLIYYGGSYGQLARDAS